MSHYTSKAYIRQWRNQVMVCVIMWEAVENAAEKFFNNKNGRGLPRTAGTFMTMVPETIRYKLGEIRNAVAIYSAYYRTRPIITLAKHHRETWAIKG